MAIDLTPGTDAWNALPRRSDDGSAGTFSVRLEPVIDNQNFKLAVWRAEPGVYSSPKGAPFAETYCVYKGEGVMDIGGARVALKPGAIINLPTGIPYTLTIVTPVEKFAVVHPVG